MGKDNDRVFPSMIDDAAASDAMIRTASEISRIGVRRRFFQAFVALETLRPIIHGGSSYLQIGASRRTPVAVDCEDLSVWQLLSGSLVVFVNSRYDLFDLSMEKVCALDLSVAAGDDVEALAALGDVVQEILVSIDPNSMEQDSFWDTFVWDVRSGSFS